MTVTHISSKAEFDQILSSFSGVIIADFFATWCGPCKMLSPIMEELAAEVNPEQVKILKIDIDEVGELAQEYAITSVPTVFVGINHEIKEGFLGANQKEFYQEKINQYLSNGAQPSTRVVRILTSNGLKMPKWVKLPTKKQAAPKHADKLRKNQPQAAASVEETSTASAEAAEA